MKLHTLLKLGALSLVLIGGLALTPVNAVAADDETTEIGEQMDRMNRAFRELRKQAADAGSNAASLELVATMRAAATAAVKHTPALAADLPEDQRPALTEGYRAQMQKFIGVLDELAAAFKAGDNTAAAELVGRLRDVQKQGHREYKKPD
jgi:soluble cytochrome b562